MFYVGLMWKILNRIMFATENDKTLDPVYIFFTWPTAATLFTMCMHVRARYLETVLVNRVEGINIDMRDMWLRYMMQEHPTDTVDILGVPANYNCKSWHWLALWRVVFALLSLCRNTRERAKLMLYINVYIILY